jgi:anaerobic magnesium-protoporphyrin IX monomethyl ester cyclase
MKILLLNIPDAHVGKTTDNWDLDASDIGIFPPIGLMYIAGALKQQGRHTVRILDCILNRLNIDDIEREACAWQPDIIGMTVYTPTLFDTVQVSNRLRMALPGARIIWGGPHTLLFPDESMAHPAVDFLVRGEAEETFPLFCNALADDLPFSHIPGIVYRNADKVLQTGDPGYVRNIDSLAFPAIDMIEHQRYFSAIGTGQAVGTICSSRGCPFQCTFCCKPYSTYRSRSVDNVLHEMRIYYDLGVREFFFFDDLFNASAKRVERIAQSIIDQNWKIVWSFRGRVDAINPAMLSLAKKAGCRQILFGVESATDEGLKEIKKRITLSQVRQAIKVCRLAGIQTSTNWIIGFPHHKSREDILNLIRTAVSIDSDFAQFNICIAYHGTEIFNEGVNNGLFDPDIWKKYALNPAPNFIEPIWDQYLSRSELSSLLNQCYRNFYLRPLPIFRKLLRIRSFREFKLYFKGALTVMGLNGYFRSTHSEAASSSNI